MTSRHRSIPHIFLLASIILLQFAVSQQGPIPVHASDLAFNPAQNLSNDRFNPPLPEVAAAGSYVYVVWQNGLQGNCSPNLSCTDIFLRASNNNGIGFNSTVDITPSDKFATNPVITAAGNNVTVAWQ